MNPGLASIVRQGRQDWETPPEIFDPLNREFGFTLDACATAQNAKCRIFYTPQQDALSRFWTGTVWMNPPYGRHIGAWIRKAYTEADTSGATVVCLVPSRTDAGWWHDYCSRGEVRFLRGRVRFLGAPYNAPFPSAIVIFRPTKVTP